MQPFHVMNIKTQCQRSPSLWVVGGELSSAPGGQSGKGNESRGSYRVFRGGSRPSSAPQGEEAQGGQVSCIVALTILYPLFPVCLRALENVTNSHSHGRDLSFTYKSSFPGHFLRPFLSSWVPSHSPMKAHTLAQLNEFPCLTHFLVFSIYENFHLLRYLNFLSVYCSALKKLFTSVLITFSP